MSDEEIKELRECLEIAAQRDKFLSDNDGLIIQELKRLDNKMLLIYQGKTPTEADIILAKLK